LKKFIAPDVAVIVQPPASVAQAPVPKVASVLPSAVSKQAARSQESLLDSPQAAAPKEQLKLVFASDLAKVPLAQQEDMVKALTRLAAPGSTRWRVWANAQEGDERAKRTTFELMASVRGVMAQKGFDESSIDMRLMLQRLAPTDAALGEIVIFVAPILEKGSAGSRS
jgi:predicted exporter